jgi:hypothetical protein
VVGLTAAPENKQKFSVDELYGNEGAKALLERNVPHAFIQWKGTDVCMDFRCPCGGGGHLDGWFAYVVECPDCGRKWEMAWHVLARESTSGWHHESAKMLEP